MSPWRLPRAREEAWRDLLLTRIDMTVSHGGTVAEPLRAKSGWIIALGFVYLIAGIVALSSIALATVVTVFLVGIMMLVSGIAEIINAFQVKSWGKFVLWLLLGGLYIIAGIL